MENRSHRLGTIGRAATLIAATLLVGAMVAAPAGAQVRLSRSLSAAPKPGKSCPAKNLGKKAKDGKLTLVCKKVHSHDQWVVSKTAVKTKTLSVARSQEIVLDGRRTGAFRSDNGRSQGRGVRDQYHSG